MDIEKILSEMTLEEKAGLCSGKDFWHTKAVERLGLPSVMVSDGPHGLRTQKAVTYHIGKSESVKAICFPSGAALASSFDRSLIAEVGDTLGKEARAEGVHTLLGPAVNMKRSPLCGRNFEYLSEDPYLAGEMGAAYVSAVQKNGVGTSVKHFAANNQEYHRMSVTAEISERALREIYLANFETVVKKARPWTVMCSYNRINGTYSCENKWLLTDVLRREWGFDGIVMTDWGAMNRRCEALRAGLNLEMPSSHGENDALIVKAVRSGTLDEKVLDKAVRELLQWIEKCLRGAENAPAGYDKKTDHALARKVETECAVLLKNERILPLKKNGKIAFIGGFAASPRYQGGGSSHINSFQVTSVLQAVSGLENISYAEGFGISDTEIDNAKFSEALRLAKRSDTAVVFAGLPESFESEGYDRTGLDLPLCQNRLIEEIAKVQPNLVVVLHNGSAVTMPWLNKVKGVLELYLGGEAVGEACADLLFGDANPGGKLAETFPLRLEDTPCYLDFPGDGQKAVYSEDVYIGYRYYDAKKVPVLFPFGYGLSYTSFEVSGLRLSAGKISDTQTLTATAVVWNTGSVAGKETVQLYVAPPRNAKFRRPLKELKGFEKIELLPGEVKEVSFVLDKRSFAYYEERIHDWYVESGDYTILVGTSSTDLPLSASVAVTGTVRLPFVFGDTTICEEIWDHFADSSALDRLANRTDLSGSDNAETLGGESAEMLRAVMGGMPLHSLINFADISRDEIDRAISELKEK